MLSSLRSPAQLPVEVTNMTHPQLLALEWALDLATKRAESMVDVDERTVEHIECLCDLLAGARSKIYVYDDSKLSLIAFMRAKGITIPQSEFDAWRMVPLREQVVGEINALPESRGKLRATNGILCYTEAQDGSLYLGHLDFFVPDPREAAVRISHNGKPKVGWVEDRALEEYFATL